MKVQRLVVPLAAAASVYARPLSIPQSSSVTARSSPNIFNEVLTPGFLDSRTVKSSVFASPDSGFGVISDIDDTIKISNVLDKLALVKSTFLEEPKPIPGMPELYSSLATSLNNPTFAYLTASPYQLYPFLNDFIDTSFSGAKGPLFTQNLTIVDIPEVIDFITSSNTFEYKTGVVDRLQEMYPNKKWLLIGDSTQKDPEVYAAAFAKHGPGAIACIWIREVEGADNSAERFGQIFRDIPQEKVKIFKDSEIASLRQVNVAAGQCS